MGADEDEPVVSVVPPPPPPHPVSRVRERITVKMIDKRKDFLREVKLTD